MRWPHPHTLRNYVIPMVGDRATRTQSHLATRETDVTGVAIITIDEYSLGIDLTANIIGSNLKVIGVLKRFKGTTRIRSDLSGLKSTPNGEPVFSRTNATLREKNTSINTSSQPNSLQAIDFCQWYGRTTRMYLHLAPEAPLHQHLSLGLYEKDYHCYH
ncbi:hypothetical protein J6590_046129 [Homalodisca vitripennis]|nr:hypothetical protein J6590_046129 [Homalodisca vitripennis]